MVREVNRPAASRAQVTVVAPDTAPVERLSASHANDCPPMSGKLGA